MMKTIIEFKAVDILQKTNIIFQNLNFKISSGEFIYIIGKTGSGKSSLLKSLYAELPIKKGSISVLDYDVEKLNDDNISNLRRKLGIVFQDFQLLTDRNLYDNLNFILKATGWKDKDKIDGRIKEVLDNVHLENCEEKMLYELSGGEQQRATIARALLNHPEIILADEPTGNLDPEKSEKIIALLKEINDKGTTIIVATHDYSIIKKFPSHTFVCENRSLVETSSENI
ncbi:MAG: ATP-binding cassette domain-containing protein [Flavobacteriales bacterium]|nr:ATP-binding cassette domain-containing protein [Flavobacteriales bacterium]